MATVINNPGPADTEASSGSSLLIGGIILLLAILALLYFGLPYLRGVSGGTGTPANVQNNVQEQPVAPPAEEGTDINVPDRIDVNVQDGTEATP